MVAPDVARAVASAMVTNGAPRDPSPPAGALADTKSTSVAGNPSGQLPLGHAVPIAWHSRSPGKRAWRAGHSIASGHGEQVLSTSLHPGGQGSGKHCTRRHARNE